MAVAVAGTNARATIEAVWRIESAKIVAALSRMVRDVGLAEEIAQEVLVTALERWPDAGVPENPGAWLMAAAKNRAIDELRRVRILERKHQLLAHDVSALGKPSSPGAESAIDEDVGDDLLRLVLVCCHPVLSHEGRVALTLRLLGGLTTDEIARAFLVPEPTIAQRIVRAKRTLSEAGAPFEVPRGVELAPRLASVLEVIYLVFNEGYSATAGDDWMRPALCEEALRLGRVLAMLVPAESEAHGLVALMELQASRLAARTNPRGDPILLLDQDRTRWDRLLIGRGMVALARAEELGGAQRPYALQAAIAACHARAVVATDTDWRRIAALYDVLAEVAPSPVVELNRGVARGMSDGPAAGLAIVDAIAAAGVLSTYHLLPAVRGELLAKLGRAEEARAAFAEAASLARNGRERAMLVAKARRHRS